MPAARFAFLCFGGFYYLPAEVAVSILFCLGIVAQSGKKRKGKLLFFTLKPSSRWKLPR